MKRLVSFVVVVVAGVAVAACASPGSVSSSSTEGLSGCHGVASSGQPSSGDYYLTSFGFSPSDDGQMSCGEFTKTGSWYYAASRQRFGCGSHIQIEANGKCVVAETDDYGPDECVEAAAGKPIIDASPLVSEYLFGTQSAGWSDRFAIHVTAVSTSTPLGPCGGSVDAGDAGSDASSGADCSSSTLDESVPTGTCVQSAGDQAWYHCVNGTWESGQSGCTSSYAWCDSSTLGQWVPPRTCVQSSSDSNWYQCTGNGWESGGESGSGPLGVCAASYPL
jgi:hypothetical protein